MSENNNTIYNNTRRNDLCPCNSGRRFKHCHGAELTQQNTISPLLTKQTLVDHNVKPFFNDMFCIVSGKMYDLNENEFNYDFHEETGEYNLIDEGQEYLFVTDNMDARIQIDLISSLIMNELAVFSTYEKHYEVCSNKFPIEESLFQQHISSLYQEGLLQFAKPSIEKILETSANNSIQQSESDIAGICIRTCDSSKYLKRILDSQIRRKNKFGVNERVYIFDDSKEKGSILENEKIIADASSEIDVYYHGLDWQINFVNKIINAFPENKTLIEMLLLPDEKSRFSGGRILNLALLFFAGKRYLNFDDDMILDHARMHHSCIDRTIQIDDRMDRINDGFSSENEVYEEGVRIEGDPLAYHKNALGFSLSDFSSSQNKYSFSNESLNKITEHTLDRYDADSVIVTSGSGYFGTPGKRDARFIFLQTYDKVAAPWVAANNFEALSTGGYCWDTPAQTKVLKYALSIPAGINNTQILAPTISTAKGEDSLFCFMTHILYPKAVHLSFNWAIAHFRHTKNWENETFHDAKLLQLSQLIMETALSIKTPDKTSNLDRINLVACALINVANKPENEFRTNLESSFLHTTTTLIDKLKKIKINNRYVESIVKRIIANEQAQLLKKDLPKVEDANGKTSHEQITWMKEETRNYANYLMIWPQLWDFCKKNDF